MKSVALPGGEKVPALGQGTWMMGERGCDPKQEANALRHGIDLGMNLIDTAEMYADGGSEIVVADAIKGQRDAVYLVGKVLPTNASLKGTIRACEESLKRLGTDHFDLYLLHWIGAVPFAETFEAFATLQSAGKIRSFGVSNFDCSDMEDLWRIPGGRASATNQILYNLTRRWPEHALQPWSRENGVPLMVYSPLEQGALASGGVLGEIAEARGVTPAQVALAWTLRFDDMFVVAKSSRIERVTENRAAAEIELTADELARLDSEFPPPAGPSPIEIL